MIFPNHKKWKKWGQQAEFFTPQNNKHEYQAWCMENPFFLRGGCLPSGKLNIAGWNMPTLHRKYIDLNGVYIRKPETTMDFSVRGG